MIKFAAWIDLGSQVNPLLHWESHKLFEFPRITIYMYRRAQLSWALAFSLYLFGHECKVFPVCKNWDTIDLVLLKLWQSRSSNKWMTRNGWIDSIDKKTVTPIQFNMVNFKFWLKFWWLHRVGIFIPSFNPNALDVKISAIHFCRQSILDVIMGQCPKIFILLSPCACNIANSSYLPSRPAYTM